ncbi:MAG: alpha/beta hydrolase [Gammaproteobacteria bacterium]|nr:alpha/beta hydrolase [Gammaproteobacteria bacterium]
MSQVETPNMPPAMRQWLDAANEMALAMREAGETRTPAMARESLDLLTRTFVTRPEEVARVFDAGVAGDAHVVPVRVYHPRPDTVLPVMVFVHGGGHVAGSVDTYDPIARRLANAVAHVVVSVDYRLAPEHPFPAGLDDVLAVVRGVDALLTAHDCAHTARLALVGDSGGGALCATVSHRLHAETAVTVHSQALIYPSLDYTLSMPSIRRLGTGHLLEQERIAWYFGHYFQSGEDRREQSPLFMPVGRMPRTLVLTAEYCPLRDEDEAYVRRLQAAGADAHLVDYAGMIHAFVNLEDLAPTHCARLYADIGRFLGA